MAQRGYPGIHAGMPTAQCLRSAVVVNGAPRSKAKAKQSKAKARRPNSRPVSCGSTPIQLWERACSRRRPDGRPIPPGRTSTQLWERACSRRRQPRQPIPVARELAPARLRSSRKTGTCCLPEEMQGLLRRPAGASSLATLGGCGVEITDRPQSPCGSLLRAAIRRLLSIRRCLIRVVPRQLPLRHQYPVHPWNPVLSSQSYPSLVRPYSAKESAWLVPESNW